MLDAKIAYFLDDIYTRNHSNYIQFYVLQTFFVNIMLPLVGIVSKLLWVFPGV